MIYDTCAWTPNRVFLAILVVESQGLDFRLLAAELSKSKQV